ncbi:MAG: hypothetical protein ACK4KW_09975 [Gemmobacter sp.]
MMQGMQRTAERMEMWIATARRIAQDHLPEARTTDMVHLAAAMAVADEVSELKAVLERAVAAPAGAADPQQES